ncbi:MAG: AraC family transcriptional regulator [Bacteroidales bacterium]|nr:AraC family transcriptional regulator [Bacteroidales bacterium]
MSNEYQFLDNSYLKLDSSSTDFNELKAKIPLILDAGVVVFVCLKGEGKIVVDMQTISIRRGSIVILLPYSVIQLADISDDTRITLIATGMGFLDKLALSQPVENYVEKIREMPCLQLNENQLEQAKKIYLFVEELYKEATGPLKQEIRSSLLTLLALEIVTLFAENKESGNPRLSRQDQVFRNFTISLAKNVSQHRTVEFYANEACLTPKYFSTVIKKRSGKLPMDWITERTIVLIKFLLHNSDKSIQEISNDLNFPNQSFFTRYFKNHTGFTPSAFRLNV